MGEELAWLSAHELRALYQRRELSPLEVAGSVLDRIDRLEPVLHAFITVAVEPLLASARLAEQALVNGDELGPLHGIPVAVKDSIPMAGMRTTYGSLLFADHVPRSDAVAVERLRAAGALLVGKTNVPEFSLISRTSNRLVAECVNPWDATRTPGGSSGGSGVAVAAGMVPVALGGDDGGSIRLPAAMTGIYGICPSQGRVPRPDLLSTDVYPGFPQGSIGPMTRDVRDAATVLAVLAGWHSTDPHGMRDLVPDWEAIVDRGVGDMRAQWVRFPGSATDGEVLKAVRSMVDELAGLGVDVVDGGEIEPLPPGANASASAVPGRFLREVRTDPARWELLTPIAQAFAGAPAPSLDDEREGSRRRAAYLAQLAARFECDVLLCPTMGFVAPVRPADPFAWPRPVTEMAAATTMVNNAGLAAASVPAGFVDGMPVGLQIIARRGDEATVLRVSRALELARPWADHHPVLW